MITEAQIMQAIAEYLGLPPEDLDRGASLKDELNLGPIELNDLLSNLSQKFGVGFENSEVESIQTVDDLIVLIEDNLLD